MAQTGLAQTLTRARPERLTPVVERRRSAVGEMLRRDRFAAAALLMVLAIVAVALLAPALPLPSPTKAKFSDKLLPPLTAGHLLGTDQLGRDLLSRLVWGARVSLRIGAAAALIASTAGAAIGLLAGYLGGRTDNVIMRVISMIDVAMAALSCLSGAFVQRIAADLLLGRRSGSEARQALSGSEQVSMRPTEL